MHINVTGGLAIPKLRLLRQPELEIDQASSDIAIVVGLVLMPHSQ